ncbi:MAG TPA: hypothetical protein VFX79_02245 [Candidatus Saccharimonadales bacterium]|nr:hypothetical protein [Candidatus Saccharimonadales bacterium]
MIQLNLLPDVKMQYINARRRKRLILGASIVVSAFFLILFILLFVYVRFAQQKHMTNLSTDIVAKTSELQSKSEINKILTVQNQLISLPGLHDEKTISSRLFDYLQQLTPSDATISDVNIDFLENKVVIEGSAQQISVVNKFADTLKFTGFIVNEKDSEGQPQQCELGSIEQTSEVINEEQEGVRGLCRAFSEVVLAEFALSDEDDNASGVTYKIEFNFDAKIFENIEPAEGKKSVELVVPNIVSTRSATERPDELFVPQGEDE